MWFVKIFFLLICFINDRNSLLDRELRTLEVRLKSGHEHKYYIVTIL